MAEHIGGNIRAWDDNAATPAPAALTVNLVKHPGGVMPADDRVNMMRIWVTISGTALNAINLALYPGRRGTTTTANFAAQPVINSVAGGVVALGQGTYTLTFAAPFAGTAMFEVPVSPGIPYQVALSRTGGGVGSLAIAVADYLAV